MINITFTIVLLHGSYGNIELMNRQQNVTSNQNLPQDATNVVALEDLDETMMNYLMYDASGGLTIDEDGKTGRMTIQDLAERCGVDRVTLWRRKKAIANWDELKREVRKKAWSDRRVTKVWNGIFLRAAKGDYQQAVLFLKNFSEDPVTIPNEKLELETGDNLTRLIELAEKRARERNIIDVEPTAENNA